jgi:hexosaminidase
VTGVQTCALPILSSTTLNGQKRMIPNPDFASQHFQVDVWNNVLGWNAEDLAYQLANAGYKVVLAGVSNFYFDMAYYKAFDEPGYYWGGYVDVDKPFYFIPFDYLRNVREDKLGNPLNKASFRDKQKLTDFGKSNVVGLKGLLWGETIQGAHSMEYMLLPKLLGLAERAWSKDPDWAIEEDSAKSAALYHHAWSIFVNVLGKRELPRLDYYAGGFHYRIPVPGIQVKNELVSANIQFPGLTLRYTTDGTEPTMKSAVYTGSIAGKGHIKVKAFNSRGRSGKAAAAMNE